ncbi:MAG: hypothetical protein U0V72_01355 [Cytophagales bacterium]
MFNTLLADDQKLSLFITTNTNLFLTSNKNYKVFYPINNDSQNKKLGIGGFGFGAFVLKPMNKLINIKGYVEVNKQRFKEAPIILSDYSNVSQGVLNVLTSNYNFNLGVLGHLSFSKKFSFGVGVGSNILILSRSKYFDLNNTVNTDGKFVIRNKNFKTFVPTIPLELQYTGKKMSYSIRFEKSLSNYYKNELKEASTFKYSSLYFLVGYRIK